MSKFCPTLVFLVDNRTGETPRSVALIQLAVQPQGGSYRVFLLHICHSGLTPTLLTILRSPVYIPLHDGKHFILCGHSKSKLRSAAASSCLCIRTCRHMRLGQCLQYAFQKCRSMKQAWVSRGECDRLLMPENTECVGKKTT